MTSLENVSTDDLKKELHRRQLKQKMEGTITITPSGVSFDIKQLKWPKGSYYVQIECIEEIIKNTENTDTKGSDSTTKN